MEAETATALTGRHRLWHCGAKRPTCIPSATDFLHRPQDHVSALRDMCRVTRVFGDAKYQGCGEPAVLPIAMMDLRWEIASPARLRARSLREWRQQARAAAEPDEIVARHERIVDDRVIVVEVAVFGIPDEKTRRSSAWMTKRQWRRKNRSSKFRRPHRRRADRQGRAVSRAMAENSCRKDRAQGTSCAVPGWDESAGRRRTRSCAARLREWVKRSAHFTARGGCYETVVLRALTV